MSQLFAKYRILSATIRIESAIPTSSGGQYAAFFDPNPSNNWVTQNAVGALTSMPVQDTAAAWECLKLVIPPAELERGFELYTQDATPESLVTRFGQFVLLCMAVPNTTPPGSAEVTVWLDAVWEFYEPNATNVANAATIPYNAGNWAVTSAGVVQPNGGVGGLQPSTAYRLFPGLPATLFTAERASEFMGVNANSTVVPYAFVTEGDALAWASGSSTPIPSVGTGTPQALPAMVAVPITPLARAVKYPYKRENVVMAAVDSLSGAN